MDEINLSKIITEYPDCMANGAKFRSILLDLYPEISSTTLFAFVVIVNSGIASDILSRNQITPADKFRWKNKLKNTYGLSENIAVLCLNCFYDAHSSNITTTSVNNVEFDNKEVISDVSSGILDIDALKGISETARDEEIANLKANVDSLTNEKNSIRIPYPDVGLYDTGSDYDEIEDLQSKKMSNKYWWDRIDELDKYLDSDSLYSGHLSCLNGGEYFFVDAFLSSKLLKNNNVFVSVNDAAYNEIFKKWKFPKKGDGIRFSRNIDIRYKSITDVTIIYDDSNAVFSSISDLFLRNVLIKNKSNNFIQSIIQTIQEKQNEIRTYNGKASIVVQGCAGSGKTMVLLHRFKYLKYNKIVSSDNYALLVPSVNFKQFIGSTANEFGLYEENIYTYAEYYKQLLNNKEKNFKEENELNFSDEFLSTVYSDNFIRKCYSHLIDFVKDLINQTVDMCDEKLSKLIEEEKAQIIDVTDNIKQAAIQKIIILLSKIPSFTDLKLNDYSDLADVVSVVKQYYNDTVVEVNNRIAELKNATISDSEIEKTVRTNTELTDIQNEIDIETEKYNKASIFTKVAHKFKLNSLTTKYEEKKQSIVNSLLSEFQRKNTQKIASANAISDTLTIEQLKEIVSDIENEYAIANKKIANNNLQISQYDEHFSKKYENGIRSLQELISISTNTDAVYLSSIKELSRCKELLQHTTYVIKTAKTFIDYKCKEKTAVPDIVEFAIKHEKNIYKMLFDELFKTAKNELKKQFKVIICKKYKHYWFIQLYFAYLLGGLIVETKKYLFIDEAQDLSPSEINLLQKVTSIQSQSICNLFGDVNQVISNYGVKNWNQFNFIDARFELDENFRNTNQIIDYCTEKIHLPMKPVGVSMSPVKEFSSIDYMLSDNISEKVFIVKDEYDSQDLIQFLNEKGVSDYQVFAVKEVKGLEFKQVIVFDEDMSRNEKYISYTRALIQLYVVKHSPWAGKQHIRNIIQGDDE